ncbi:MAG: DUF1349 domain-containing protein [Opitutales bacterium]|nr:DUF1349 domain-containing protein [Opitutales bacterium]
MRLLSNHFLSLILFSLVSVVTVALGQTELFYAKKIGGTATGFASYHCETERFEIKSRISNISDSADSFQFVYRELTGDLDITVHVPSISASLAGLMIRSGSGENQSFAMVGIEGSNTITRYRLGTNHETTNGIQIGATNWLRISREGNSISSFRSADGISWALIETRAVDLGHLVFAGIAAVNGTVQFGQLEVDGTLESLPAVDPGPSMPPASVSDPSLENHNSGTGDYSGLEPDLYANPDLYLATPTGLASKIESDTKINLYWVDSVKNENGFRIERKTEDGPFVVVADIPPSSKYYLDKGLRPNTRYTYRVQAYSRYVSSEYSNEAWDITHDGPGLPDPEPENPNPPDPDPTPPSPPPTTPGTFNEVFSVHNVGAENQVASSDYDEDKDMFRLSADGGCIWGLEDEFRYVYREISGDVEATIKVSSLEAGDEFGKAGIMFRESASKDARHAFLTISAGKGVALERRKNEGEGTVRSGKGNVSAPVWLRLIKEDNYLSAYYSEDGDNWSFLSEDIIDFPNTISIGLAVAAHGEDDSVTADFGELQIVELQSESATETFISADIGKVGVNGNAAYDSDANSFIVEASGGDIGHNQDAFHYVFREVAGDFVTVTKVDSLVAEEDWAKAGLMVRESFRPDSQYFATFMAKNVGILHQHRATIGGDSNWSKVDGVETPFWLKISRSGNLFTASYSLDGAQWNVVNEANLTLSETVVIGMAVTSHKEGALAYAEFSDLLVSN